MNIRETLRIERGTYLSLDFLPEDVGHLIALHLDNGGLNLDLIVFEEWSTQL